MTARTKFRIGMRVHFTREAYLANIRPQRGSGPVFGTVVHFTSGWPDIVAVVVDGTKTREAYHVDFWTEDRKR